MTPRTKALFCRTHGEKESIGSLEDLVLVPVNVQKRREKRPMTDLAMTEIHLDPGLEHLVRLRVAQIHGCEWSIQEQTKKLKAEGETARRLRLLKDWRKQTAFCLREKAALNLAEALTGNPINGVPKEAVHVARIFFDKAEMICLTVVILAINDWRYLSGSCSTPNLFHEN